MLRAAISSPDRKKGMPMQQIANCPNPDASSSAIAPWFAARTTALKSIAKTFFLLMVCGYFSFHYALNSSFLKLPLYTRGLERTPYQYRVLTMVVFRIFMRSHLTLRLASHLAVLNNDPYRLISTGIAFFGLLGALIVTRLTITRLTGDGTYAFWAALMLALMSYMLLASNGCFTLPYDVPTLFFFSLGIYLVISRRLWLYYIVFPLVVLNRETACFITVFFVIWEWVRLAKSDVTIKSRLLQIAPHALVQATIWIAIKMLLAKAYAHNPVEVGSVAGGLFHTMLAYNLHEIIKPQQWPVLLSVCGFSLPFLFLQRRWIRCDGLYYACAIILPAYFACMMIVGVIVELRIFTEWIPLVVPAIALIIHNRLRPATEAVP
jgi:hypothetical protein